ncbi:class I SAM-dependent methyltransferase [Neisseriaceae bacterium PsAf]|nr:class I SAM-dependent methyltransferase [Neisseriaceae bacterium PsAf]
MSQLPLPSPEEKKISDALIEVIISEIKQNDGFLPFHEYVNLVLYFPTLGYYSGNKEKIGVHGDFITAPNLHPIFAQTLARQITEILEHTEKNIYEFGAGTGNLAADLLNFIPEHLVKNYYIIDISNHLSQQQLENIQNKAPKYFDKVRHLSSLPEQFNGVIIGNEILDAIPFNLIEKKDDRFFEMGVSLDEDKQLILSSRPLTQELLLDEAQEYLINCPEPYQTELHLRQKAFIKTICQKLDTAAAIFIDYGFEDTQYYHPQRSMGTMMGHYQHHSISDPFFYPGLTDLTCHINFSTIADSIVNADADLIGYTSQGIFLMNLGIIDYLNELSDDTTQPDYLKAGQACQILINPQEMGEFFKVIAFGKNIDIEWQGFISGDWTHKL